jgi:Zn-dependent protease with chaperone function
VMSAAAGAALLVLLVVLPAFVRARSGASPRVAAGAHLVSLLGWGVVPAVWLACFSGSLSSWLTGSGPPGKGCLMGFDRGEWQLLGYTPAAVVLGLLAWEALGVAIATHRAELRGVALARSACYVASGGTRVWVVDYDQPVAYAGGLCRPRAVVTTALLAPLEEAERRAVCEHEAAHLRLGHPRLLLAGGSVAAAYGAFPPVRRAWDGLRRELEAAADDEAARAVGRETVISALARVALLAAAKPKRSTASFGDVEHLRYRMARLEEPRPVRRAPTATVASAAAGLVAAMAWSMCLQTGTHATPIAVAACSTAVAIVGLRPLWGRRFAAGAANAGNSPD